MPHQVQIGLLGAGKLGRAFLKGLSSIPDCPPVVASVRSEDSLNTLKRSFPRFEFTHSNEAVLGRSSYLFVGLKPKVALEVLKDLKDCLGPQQDLFSFCAGLNREALSEIWKASQGPKIHRLMANTGMERKVGILGHCSDYPIPESLEMILSQLGLVLDIEESQFDAFTTLTASAPAFVLEFLKGLEQFSKTSRLSDEVTRATIPQLLYGLASLLSDHGDIESRIQQIATPGGMTIVGLDHLRRNSTSQLAELACELTQKKAKSL